MGVDVASFGDFFADKKLSGRSKPTAVLPSFDPSTSKPIPDKPAVEVAIENSKPPAPASAVVTSKPSVENGRRGRKQDAPIKCLVYNDPFSSTYKKYIFSADGKHLLGGMMIGDVGDYVKLVAIVKKKVRLCSCYCSDDS